MRLLIALTFLYFCASSLARQQYRGLLPNGNFVPCPPGDPHCEEGHICEGIGHESCAGGILTPGLNAFGKDLLKEEAKWKKELCERDSDGDGFSNGYELGDPCCIWKKNADVPDWMLDWPISHPGSRDSTQLEDRDIEALCEGLEPLEVADMFAEGEERITWDFVVKDYIIPAQHTAYADVRFNFPEGVFYLVGADALVDNKAMVHHYVVTSCPETVDENLVGEARPYSEGNHETCPTTLWVWAPGGELRMPSEVAIPLGISGRKGINIQIHYNNPEELKGRTDASILRLYVTTKPRKHEGGVLYTGSITSMGVIPPKKTVYASTVYQVKVDTKIASNGVTVYAFTPHMHALGKKIWVEKLTRSPNHKKGILAKFDDLDKVQDVARDDFWHIDYQAEKEIPNVRIKDGDYLATTCIYNSDKKNNVTVGGIAAQEEMCVGFLSFFPANAVDTVVMHKGPLFFNELSEAEDLGVHSFVDIVGLPKSDSRLPLWRRAYLSGELECKNTKPTGENSWAGKILGIHISSETYVEGFKACAVEFMVALFAESDPIAIPECTTECARFVYQLLGCSLVWQSTSTSGVTMDLFPSVLEGRTERFCSEAFERVYEADKID